MTNILVTVWPASIKEEILTQMYADGVRILRFNFPHYNQETTLAAIKVINKVEKKIRWKFQLLLDTEWPEIRTWALEKPIPYAAGEKFRIVIKESKRGDRDIFCDYPQLIKDVKIGQIIKIDSWLFDVKVIEKGSESLVVQAFNAFTVGSRRHINLPGMHVKLPGLTTRDKENVVFACKHLFSYIALSFTRTKHDVQGLREILEKNNGTQIKIIAKIENQEWLENLDAIMDVSDMIMVARGDLGTELPVETIPLHQMNMVRKCKLRNMPVIVATQMLETMITNPIPTRAEVSDIFYAVLEWADYVMLSGETAVGKYPLQCVEVMKKVIEQAEKL